MTTQKLPPQAGLTTALKAGVKTVIDKAPVLGALSKFTRELVATHQEERLDYWSSCIANDDPDAFRRQLEGALQGPEGDIVRTAIVDSARSAVDAIAADVVPSIALLTSSFFKRKTPDRRTFRELLGILKALDDSEFRTVREAAHLMAGAPNMPPDLVQTLILLDPGADTISKAVQRGVATEGAQAVWVWYTNSNPTVILALGDAAPRLVHALSPLDGDLHRSLTGGDGAPNSHSYSRRLIEVLTTIMPLPSSG